MTLTKSIACAVALLLAHFQACHAQSAPVGDTRPVNSQADQSAGTASASDGAIMTRKDARTITMKIPAPRGQIVDRLGEPLAQNVVAYQIGLQFRQFDKEGPSEILTWAKEQMAALAPHFPNLNIPSDQVLLAHYRDRRWLPLLLTEQLDDKEIKKIEPSLTSGLVVQPLYRRYYPGGELAAHIVGYAGSVGKLPTGPINFNEPLWEESEGRAGLEKLFNQELSGDPGMKKLLFDEAGNKLLEEQVKRPRPGGTVVTTLNRDWQELAEKTLRNGCRRGAFVVIDAISGEVLVMASRPSFDLNAFVPGISEVNFKELNEDPSQPLFGRAFQSAYPPASTYKAVVALAALNEGVVTEKSTIYCPASIRIGRTTFRNWSKTPEGSINVRRAIARSTNTWFYQVGIDMGAEPFLSLSRRLGMGERSGLPLIGETAGLVPSNEWMLKHEKRRILDGDTANLSIGQGSLLASPLQVAQAMAGIANGGALPRLQLIRQVHDTRGRVVKVTIPEQKNSLGVNEKSVKIVQNGMSDVVNSGGGTGQSAGLSYTSLCGKTGTAQWGPKSKNQRLAWFAGFLPKENPRYAFAVLYEGRPGETVSGGRMAAPMVRRFFEGVKKDIKEEIAPPKKALVVSEDGEPEDPAAASEADSIEDGAQEVSDEVADEISDEEVTDGSEVAEDPNAPDIGALRALPVDELETDAAEERPLSDELEAEQQSDAIAPEIKPERAIPVGEDEIIQQPVEEP